jgi:hypothetical protein
VPCDEGRVALLGIGRFSAGNTVGRGHVRPEVLLRFIPVCALTVACGAPTVFDAARDRAVADLTCPVTDVRAYRARGGVIVVKGCGKWVQYGCFYSRKEPVCVRDGSTEELPMDPAYDAK